MTVDNRYINAGTLAVIIYLTAAGASAQPMVDESCTVANERVSLAKLHCKAEDANACERLPALEVDAAACENRLPTQQQCDILAQQRLFDEVDCLRTGQGQCERTDLAGLKSGCSFGNEAALRESVGLIANAALPNTPAVDPVQTRARSARYPLAAFMAGREGEGQFVVDVDAQGRTFGADILRSSGHRDLDRSALEWIRTLRFIPAMAGGTPVAGRVRMPVKFEIGGRTMPDEKMQIPAIPPAE